MFEEKMKETKSCTKENLEENNKKINLTLIKKETPINPLSSPDIVHTHR